MPKKLNQQEKKLLVKKLELEKIKKEKEKNQLERRRIKTEEEIAKLQLDNRVDMNAINPDDKEQMSALYKEIDEIDRQLKALIGAIADLAKRIIAAKKAVGIIGSIWVYIWGTTAAAGTSEAKNQGAEIAEEGVKNQLGEGINQGAEIAKEGVKNQLGEGINQGAEIAKEGAKNQLGEGIFSQAWDCVKPVVDYFKPW